MTDDEVPKKDEEIKHEKIIENDSEVQEKSDENSVENEEQNPSGEKRIIHQLIDEEMKEAYLDYAMSVIIGRALPNAKDGLKPVHRRILYTMWESGLVHNKPFRKSANVVGMCMAKYHPHGDLAIYDSLVRMAQDFSLRYTLVEGQGNFGSIDGDSPAAMRYTEAKMKKIAEELMQDINKETVNFIANFDGSTKEPETLPSKFPNLLLNGSSGIAVGMATNIPPHNLSEVCKAAIFRIENPESTIAELMKIIPGPDFPTAGTIIGRPGIQSAYSRGRGIIKVRGKCHQERVRNREALIITEIPYMVNKSAMITQIADAVKDKRIEGIADIRDETDRTGIRVVIELKRDASLEVIENQLIKHSRYQVSFGINMLAILDKKPIRLSLSRALDVYIKHRKEVIIRRTEYDLKKAQEKAHLLEGLVIALDNVDAVVKLIKASKSVREAREGLMKNFDLSEKQSQAILELKLQKLTSLEQNKIKNDLKETLQLIKALKEILDSEEIRKTIIKNELEELIDKYGDERRTDISEEEDDVDIEDLIEEEDQVIMITDSGYVKRMPIETYKVQNRGGKGVIGMQTKEEDFIEDIFIANTKSYLLCFTEKGKVHWLKVYRIPEATRQSKGKAIINLLELDKEDSISAVIPIKNFNDKEYLAMITRKGIIKKTDLTLYSKPRKGGINAINLDEGDNLVKVLKTDGHKNIMIATSNGQAIRFDETNARPIGRTARGVRAINLAKEKRDKEDKIIAEADKVIGAIIAKDDGTILTITENGYGKRSSIPEYRLIKRGGKGVRNIICSPRNGKVVEIRQVYDSDELIIISKQGQTMRLKASQISVIGRNTQGLRIMKLKEGDKVTSTAKVVSEE
jgi:DNA gyrase subunit A